MPPVKELQNMALTRQLYCYIVNYVREHQIPPSQREMAEACYMSNGNVSRHLDRLHMYGWIVRNEGRHRGIQLGNPAPFSCDDCCDDE